jgi:26S proteasome regulatory subunit N11
MKPQQSFEQLNNRAVAVVVDPILSVKGKVVVDAFRLIKQQMQMMGLPPRQTTSLLGHLKKPTIKALMHGLNKHYYSMAISFRRNELEDRMLSHLGRPAWSAGLQMGRFEDAEGAARDALKRMVPLLKQYAKEVTLKEEEMTEDELAVAKAGKVDAKRELETSVRDLLSRSISDCMGMMLGTVAFDDVRLIDVTA